MTTPNRAELRLVVDAETDGLLRADGDKPAATKVHCFCTINIDTGEKRRFRLHSPVGSGQSIEEGLAYLQSATLLVNHNLVGFDLEVLKKLYPAFRYTGKVRDTLLCSCLIWTNLWERDSVNKKLPPALWGRQSLEAWGLRLGIKKGDFGKHTDWKGWTQPMEDYCAQDVEVTFALWRLIEKQAYSEAAIELEHQFKAIIIQQEAHGFRLDMEAANALTRELQVQRQALTEKLQKVFAPTVETMKTPAYYVTDDGTKWPTKGHAKAGGYKDAQITPGPLKTKTHLFNPGSRVQIADRLIEKYGWKPTKYTDSGQVQIDETVLADLEYEEAPLLSDFLTVGKILGQLAEGDGAVVKLSTNGRVHGGVITNGAVTGRCTHSKPNIAQTPKVLVGKNAAGKKEVIKGLDGGFGWEFRSLYLADEGQVLAGWDASGLELRCLAHYLNRYDGGAFEKILLEGDVHTANQTAAGLYLRDSAKTFIYAFLYGAGDEKLGKIVRQDCIDAGKSLPKGDLKTLGKRLRTQFLKGFPALARLKEAVGATVKQRGYLFGIDGRKLHVRSEHAALNTLLQSAGALLMKKALVFQYETLSGLGYVFGKDFAFVANVHDEVQTTCRPDIAEIVGKAGPAALKASGKFFEFKCQLDGEYKTGPSWAMTH